MLICQRSLQLLERHAQTQKPAVNLWKRRQKLRRDKKHTTARENAMETVRVEEPDWWNTGPAFLALPQPLKHERKIVAKSCTTTYSGRAGCGTGLQGPTWPRPGRSGRNGRRGDQARGHLGSTVFAYARKTSRCKRVKFILALRQGEVVLHVVFLIFLKLLVLGLGKIKKCRILPAKRWHYTDLYSMFHCFEHRGS